MGTFANEFDTDKPVGSQEANTLDTIIEAKTKKSLAERYELEHVALNSGESTATNKTSAIAQGRHVPGLVGVLFTGTQAELDSFTSIAQAANGIGKGAMALIIDPLNGNALYHWSGSTWDALGLTAAIYTQGSGIIISSQIISADFADVDAIVAGTADNKIIAVADMKWAYGLTEYMELKQIQAADTAEVWEATPEFSRKWNKTIINTIEDSALSTDHQITLPVGVYLIENTQPFFTDESTFSNKLVQTYLYNETAVAIATDLDGNEITSNLVHSTAGLHGTNNAVIKATFSIVEESIFSIRCTQDAGDEQTSGSNATLSQTYGILQIWKKKLVIV